VFGKFLEDVFPNSTDNSKHLSVQKVCSLIQIEIINVTDHQFFYNGIRALEKCWTKCISVAGDYIVK